MVMHRTPQNFNQSIAQAVRDFEKRRTKHSRKWMAVFLNEQTMVIAIHGTLTATEKVLAQSLAGAIQVREFHRHLFANLSASLLRKILCITGMKVQYTTAEIEPTTDSVVQIFTSDTVREEFLLTPSS